MNELGLLRDALKVRLRQRKKGGGLLLSVGRRRHRSGANGLCRGAFPPWGFPPVGLSPNRALRAARALDTHYGGVHNWLCNHPHHSSTYRVCSQALDEPFLVAVVGEFNSGKSSVINALLGRCGRGRGRGMRTRVRYCACRHRAPGMARARTLETPPLDLRTVPV